MRRIKLTLTLYDGLSSKDIGTNYLIKNAGKLYKGENLYWSNFTEASETVLSITVTTPPARLNYKIGDTLNLAGIIITATYVDGHTAVIDNYSTIPADGSVLTHEHDNIVINYLGKTCTLAINLAKYEDYLCFTANQANSTVCLTQVGNPSTLKNFAYSTDKVNWFGLSFGQEGSGPIFTLANIGDKIYFKGSNNTLGESTNIYNKFIMEGSISASGNLNTLLSFNEDIISLNDGSINRNYCFVHLFDSCISLIGTPYLPAVVLSNYCYAWLFSKCSSIVNSPNLPATTLAESCYRAMFLNCSSLINASALPATTLAASCYLGMFKSCTALINAPKLPAMTMTDSGYSSMFAGCTSLVIPPALPAMTLADSCYKTMFQGCTALICTPALPATNLVISCYLGMFMGCSALVSIPKLPATSLVSFVYTLLFSGCVSLYISESPIRGIAEQVWTIPSNGTFITNLSTSNIFKDCLGDRPTYGDTLPGKVGQSYIYYTQNVPIG